MDNQNTSSNEDQVTGKNQEDVPSNSRRHPVAGIPTGNIGGGPYDEIQAETAGGKNSLKSRIEGLAGKRTRMEVANVSVSSFDKLRKNLDIRVWPPVNKKPKLLSSAAILSLPSSSNAASNDAESNAAEPNAAASNASVATISALASVVASVVASVLVPLLAASSNPTNTLALTNLPSSSSNRYGDKFKSQCIICKPDYVEKEIQTVDVNLIKVRVNFKPPNEYWSIFKFLIDKNTTYNQLRELLLSKMLLLYNPVPRKMKIFYEDRLGDFVDLADDRDMIFCLRDCGRLINLVIEEDDQDGARL